MTPTGIVRKIDELGRVVIPMDLRKRFDLKEGDAVEIYIQDNMIVLKKYQPFCIFCGGSNDVFSISGKMMCKECAQRAKIIADNM